MREIRTSGSEGGGAGYSTGPPYPYPTDVPEGTVRRGFFGRPPPWGFRPGRSEHAPGA